MKFLVVFAVALAAAAAAELEPVPIIKSSYEQGADGAFNYVYESADGTSAQAEGVVKNFNSEHPASEVKGGYGYTSPEGKVIQLNYIANEDGFQPQGEHLPTSPPIPEAILRSLRYLAEHPQAPVEYVAKSAAAAARV